jgi:hypothetical protein
VGCDVQKSLEICDRTFIDIDIVRAAVRLEGQVQLVEDASTLVGFLKQPQVVWSQGSGLIKDLFSFLKDISELPDRGRE